VQETGALLRLYGHPKEPWRCLRSANLMERLIREVRRGTKVRDHKFPQEGAAYKLLYLESERQEGRWAGRKLKRACGGEGGAAEDASGAVCPRTQTLTRDCPTVGGWGLDKKGRPALVWS